MANHMFRALTKDEIEIRVVEASENGVKLIPFKSARVDQNLLDETVGPMNWKCEHLHGNSNCTLSIHNESTGEWIAKEGVGASYEMAGENAEKALASDALKRAGYLWGIGRELYTAPKDIFVKAADCNLTKNADGSIGCYDKFYIEQIIIDDETRKITALAIRNANVQNENGKDKRVFVWDGRPAKEEAGATANA